MALVLIVPLEGVAANADEAQRSRRTNADREIRRLRRFMLVPFVTA